MRNSYKAIFAEHAQSPETRQSLFEPIQKELGGRALVTLFTSFQYNVALDDTDADMLQSVLQQSDLSKGLVLMLHTPGGDGLAAERIVNICKAYSGTGDFWVLVPGKAKSAGTIIALGASKILMSTSSELGPVDPQIFRNENGRTKVFSAHSDKLFAEATAATGPMEPLLIAAFQLRHSRNKFLPLPHQFGGGYCCQDVGGRCYGWRRHRRDTKEG
jgi:hypothetical protein